MALLGVLTSLRRFSVSLEKQSARITLPSLQLNMGTDDCFMLVADHSAPHQVAWTYLSEIPNVVKHPAAGED